MIYLLPSGMIDPHFCTPLSGSRLVEECVNANFQLLILMLGWTNVFGWLDGGGLARLIELPLTNF